MNETPDPRADGFNYGAGWGTEPKPPVYHTAMQLARDLGKRAMKMSRDAWELEMAVRHVRIASMGVEKSQAMQKLEILLAKHQEA
jgi:hypothetical protein